MENKENYLIELLKESYDCVNTAISVELEYNAYDRVEVLKKLKKKIEKEITSS